MRFAVIQAIYEEAVKNKDVFFITGDLGHANEQDFKDKIPNQYLNAGLSEQNIVGVAAGLALSGKKVFIYSIVPFITMRCYEQVKADLCYQNLDVTIIGIGGGFIYGQYGNTHCSIEDIAVMRVLPNMKIVCPANPHDATLLINQVIKMKGPTYIRIGRGKEPMPHELYDLTFGKGAIRRSGTDITFFCTGTTLSEVEKSAELLQQRGVSAEIIHLHTVKPIDTNLIRDRAAKRKAIFTIEDHSIIGGLGGALAEIISEDSSKPLFKRFGAHDTYLKEIGTEAYLRNAHGFSAKKISHEVLRTLKQKK